MGIRIETDMRSDLFKKFQTLDYQFYDDKKTGELMTNLTTHLHDVSEMSHHAPEDIFISFVMIIGSFVILINVNLLLTLIVFVFLFMLITYSLSRRRKMLATFRKVRSIQGELNAEVESSLSGIRLTKAFTNEEYEQEKFEKINRKYRKARSNVFREIGLFGSGNDVFINLANSRFWFSAAFSSIRNTSTPSTSPQYFLYINFLIKSKKGTHNSMETASGKVLGQWKFH